MNIFLMIAVSQEEVYNTEICFDIKFERASYSLIKGILFYSQIVK